MKKKDVIKYFGGVTKAAQALKLSRQAVYQWPEVVPIRQALKVANLSNHEVDLRLRDYK